MQYQHLNYQPLKKRTLSKVRWLLFSVLFSSLLTSCGFHLRGIQDVPDALTSLTFHSQSGMPTFDRFLRQTLAERNITIVEQQKSDLERQIVDAQTLAPQVLELKVLPIELVDRTLSTSNDNDTNTLSRTLKATYFLRAADGKSVYGPRFISVSSTLYNQDGAIDSVNAQQVEGLQNMQQALADKLINDLLYAPL
ncbi:hypothetical protein CBF23_005925 [Marinomonas agarivorans]|nr:hypothetical protein CBF23_005925 [Marinomonas agarivorans]